MKILLVRPKPHKDTIGLQHIMVCQPLELEYLIGNLPNEIKNSLDIEIVDMILENRSFQSILEEKNPNMVFFTGYITHVGLIKNCSKQVKEFSKDTLVGVGGVHAEVVPEDFADANIDLVFKRNGIDGFNKVVELYLKGESLAGIKNAVEKTNISPIDFKLRLPDRSFVNKYKDKYYYMFHNPCALIKTSYGCPYSCSFCFCKEITGGAYYSRSMEDVIEELLTIKEEEIYIVDDDFLYGQDKLREFIRLLKENNIKKKYLVYGRADFIVNNKDLIGDLKEVGLGAIIVGIESIREKDLKDYNKGTSKNINEACIKILKELDIELYATMIIPLDFSKDDFKGLTRWLNNLQVAFVNLQPLTPLPGTSIFDEYKDKLLVKREDYHMWDMAHVVLRPEKMSIRQFYFQMLKSYYKVIIKPKNALRLIRKYGFNENVKLLWRSQRVSIQYLQKIWRGY